MKRLFLAAFLLATVGALTAQAQDAFDEVKPSTQPIGSPFYRHLAKDFNLDLRELVKFEKRGFGHAEIVTLVLISSSTQKPLKDYGNRRLKDKVTLKALAGEAGLNYPTLYEKARQIKTGLEAKGDKDLPPPVFEKPKKDPDAVEKKETKEPLDSSE